MLLWQGDDSDPEPEAYIDGYSYDDLSDSSSSYYYGSESLDLTGSQSADPEPTSYDFYGLSENSYPLYQSQGKDILVYWSNQFTATSKSSDRGRGVQTYF